MSAATGGMSTATVAVLSAAIIRGLAMTHLKFAATAILAAVALATTGALAVGSWRVDPPRAAMPPQAGPEMKRPPAASEAPAPAPAEFIEVRGRVVGPWGNPVAGAAVHTTSLDSRATSGPDGRFVMRVPRPGRSRLMGVDATFPWLIAAAPGFGLGWVHDALKKAAEGEVTIRLVDEGVPIEGRIVNLEGRPVAGARIKLDGFWYARSRRDVHTETGDLSDWIAGARDTNARFLYSGLGYVAARFVTVTTDADGRFRLPGIGRERIALFLVEGPTIATCLLNAMTRNGPEIRCIDPRSTPARTTVFHGARFASSVEPTKPVEGVVRDADTRLPIAGLRIRGGLYAEHSRASAPGVEATTDAQGRYRLVGLPRAPAYPIFVEPGEGRPYPRAKFRTPAVSPAFDPVIFDIALKRGVLVRGRVTDKATGRPAPGYVNVYAVAGNPHVREFPGYAESTDPRAPVEDDGRFEVVALPGRNVIACCSERYRYRLGVGAGAIRGYDPRSRTIPAAPDLVNTDDYHILAELDLASGAESATVDLQVNPGRTITVTTVNPEGRPIGETTAFGLMDLYPPHRSPQASPTFEVRALDPARPRRVTMTHAGRKLAGSVYLKGHEAGPLTVRLLPWGAITGRVLDGDGTPRANVVLRETDDMLFDWPPEPYGLFPQGNRTGDDGRFRIEGLVPGLKYAATVHGPVAKSDALFRDLTVAPGEVKDLGDLRVSPDGRNP